MIFDAKAKFERARALARQAHGSQKYGDLPYEFHLQAVVDVLFRFGATLDNDETAPLLVAAWLHDTLEDTELDKQAVADEFGADIAEIVCRVTDEPGENRKARKAATYAKTAASEAAVIVKLADRIANVEESLQNNKGLFRMYAKEQASFSSALRSSAQGELAQRLWQHLDDCFDKLPVKN